jgi:hypothetical protein
VEQKIQIILLNLSPKSRQFVHLLDNKQANSTRLDESKVDDSISGSIEHGITSDLHEPTEMEITTLETTNANASAMDITITDVHQTETHPQASLLEILRQLIVDSKLLNNIIIKLKEARIYQGMKTRTPLPAYNGHLTEIANCFEDAMKCHEFIRVEFEKMITITQLEEWKKFVGDELVKFNEKNLTAIGQIRSDLSYKPVELDTDKVSVLYGDLVPIDLIFNWTFVSFQSTKRECWNTCQTSCPKLCSRVSQYSKATFQSSKFFLSFLYGFFEK